MAAKRKSIITAFALDGIGLDALKVAVLLRIVEIIRFGERSFDFQSSKVIRFTCAAISGLRKAACSGDLEITEISD